jgi:hypothetical protein
VRVDTDGGWWCDRCRQAILRGSFVWMKRFERPNTLDEPGGPDCHFLCAGCYERQKVAS